MTLKSNDHTHKVKFTPLNSHVAMKAVLRGPDTLRRFFTILYKGDNFCLQFLLKRGLL